MSEGEETGGLADAMAWGEGEREGAGSLQEEPTELRTSEGSKLQRPGIEEAGEWEMGTGVGAGLEKGKSNYCWAPLPSPKRYQFHGV